MDLTQALKSGILPTKANPIELVLTAHKEKLCELVKSQVKVCHELFRECDVVTLRKRFLLPDVNLTVEPLKLRGKKLYRPMTDATATQCKKCKTVFDLFTRKHHCRACGDIFCYSCCQGQEHIPNDLIKYKDTKGWFLSGNLGRVCQGCRDLISKYRKIEDLVKYFEIIALPIDLCQKALHLSKDWKEAMKVYLANVRDICHFTPLQKLQDRDKRWLLSNLDNLQGHNRWLLQALKLGVVTTEGPKVKSCEEMMCEKGCTEKLTVFDCLSVVNSPEYTLEAKLVALSVIQETHFPNYLVSFIPIEEGYVQEFALKQKELFLDFFWMSRVNTDYVADIFKNKLLLNNPEEAIHVQESIRLISCLDQWSHDVYRLSCCLQEIQVPFVGPFGRIDKFEEEIFVKQSATRPTVLTYESEGLKKSLLYKKEDVRKDAHLVSLIRLMYLLCEDLFPEGDYLATYRVAPVSSEAGFIEIVSSSVTLFDILSKGSISNYLYRPGNDKKISDVNRNYFNSLAFWIVITFLLGVGDRHLENIMIRDDGILFHIDYGFIFGSDLSSSPVRLDDTLLEGVGGVDVFPPFKEMCCKLYLRLRNHFNLIYSCMLRLVNIKPAIKGYNFTYDFVDSFLSEKFSLGDTDEEAEKKFSQMMDDSRGTFINKMSDIIHTTVSSFKTKWWS